MQDISTTTMLEFVESGATVLLLELTTLNSNTSSSDYSMEFKICTAPRMFARKTQTQKYVSNMLSSIFPCINLWGQ
jgi:hypothetical protein